MELTFRELLHGLLQTTGKKASFKCIANADKCDREFGDYDSHYGVQTVNRTTQERRYKKSFFDLVDFVNARMPTGK